MYFQCFNYICVFLFCFRLICHVCNEEFLIWEKLQNHTKEMHQVKPKILCVCNQYLSNKQKFYQHIKMHDSKSQDRKFAHRWNQYVLLSFWSEMQSNFLRIVFILFVYNLQSCMFHFRCTKCDCSFNTPKNLEKHNLLLHPNSITTPEFKCEHCKKTFTQIHLLKSHEVKHLPPEVKKIHPCQLCELKYVWYYIILIQLEWQCSNYYWSSSKSPKNGNACYQQVNDKMLHSTLHLVYYLKYTQTPSKIYA